MSLALTAAPAMGDAGRVTPLRAVAILTPALLCACARNGGISSDGGGDAANVASTLRDQLAGAWSFDVDGSDHSGHGLDLAIDGLHLATGMFGQGLQFSGDGTPIAQRPIDDPSLNLTSGDFTISFWINFTMTASAQFVVVKGYNVGGWFVGWAQTAWAFGLPEGDTFSPPSGPPTTGTFHQVVVERAGDTLEMFVDLASFGPADVKDSPAPGPSPFQVGGYAPGGVMVASGQDVVSGVVDDLAVWHRAITPDERAYLMTNPVP